MFRLQLTNCTRAAGFWTSRSQPSPPLEAIATAFRCPELPEGPLLGSPLQVRWAKKTKRKRLPKMADRTAEQKTITAGRGENRLEDKVFNPESPYTMSLNIRGNLRGLTSDGRHNTRRKKDLSRYTNYRVMRIAGLTHDNPKEETDRRGFTTPLTEMQDNSNLPRSLLHRRFSFPHMLNYKVFWGPPTVQEEPNAYDGSMVSAAVAFRLEDLPLTARQKERLVDIVGNDMVDEETGVVALEVDNFTERNQNAALCGDMLEQLLREATAADNTVEQRSQAVDSELSEHPSPAANMGATGRT